MPCKNRAVKDHLVFHLIFSGSATHIFWIRYWYFLSIYPRKQTTHTHGIWQIQLPVWISASASCVTVLVSLFHLSSIIVLKLVQTRFSAVWSSHDDSSFRGRPCFILIEQEKRYVIHTNENTCPLPVPKSVEPLSRVSNRVCRSE